MAEPKDLDSCNGNSGVPGPLDQFHYGSQNNPIDLSGETAPERGDIFDPSHYFPDFSVSASPSPSYEPTSPSYALRSPSPEPCPPTPSYAPTSPSYAPRSPSPEPDRYSHYPRIRRRSDCDDMEDGQASKRSKRD